MKPKPAVRDQSGRRSRKAARLYLGSFFLAVLGAVLPPPAATVAYYRFEEGSNGFSPVGIDTIVDWSGNGISGTPFGKLVYSSHVPANPVPLTGAPNLLSLAFDGSSGRIFLPDNPLLELTKSLSVEAFINAASFGAGPYSGGQIVFRGDDRASWVPYRQIIHLSISTV